MSLDNTDTRGFVWAGKKKGAPPDIDVQGVRTQLRRILSYRAFSGSPRLGEFLQFVVEEALTGRSKRIKEIEIAQEVFNRDENFDPRSDAIVRVEAGRLRRRLSEYYLTEGADDPILIVIPKGSYTAKISRRTNALINTEGPTVAPRRDMFTMQRGIVAFVLLFAASLAVWSLGWSDTQRAGNEQFTARQNALRWNSPFVAILPVRSITGNPIEHRVSAALNEALILNLTKLSGLSVLAHNSMLKLEGQASIIRNLQAEFGVSHILRGSLERESDSIRVSAQLIETSSGATIWAHQFTNRIADPAAFVDQIAGRITDQLAVQINTGERKFLQSKHTDNLEVLVLYRQALEILMPPNDSSRMKTSRQLFRRIVELDPDFSGGYAGESLSLLLSVVFGTAAAPGRELETAKRLAKIAIKRDATFGMGFASLGFAACLSKEYDACLELARKSISVQPGDALTRWMFGVNLLLSGRPREAIVQLQEAIRLDPIAARTPYLNLLGMAHFHAGEYATALDILNRNLARGGPDGPHMDLYRACALIALGEDEKAQVFVEKVSKFNAFWPEMWLSKWLDPADHRRTVNSLYRIGLPKRALH